MCSGFEVLVDCRHIQHNVLPIGPFSSHHFINVLPEKEEAWLEFSITSWPATWGWVGRRKTFVLSLTKTSAPSLPRAPRLLPGCQHCPRATRPAQVPHQGRSLAP